MRRALVTGATGGLGMVIVPTLLAAGHQVRATGRNASAGACLARLGAEFVPADLCDPANAPRLAVGMDLIVHAAALSSPWGASEAFQAINVEATAALLAAARRGGCDSFIYISTPSIYAEPRDRLDLTEASPLARRFANAYVRTKYEAEQQVLAANAPGLATMALRPRAIIGPHDQTLMPRLARIARSGYFPMLHGGRALIDTTDARDAAEAVLAADQQRNDIGGRAYNLSGGAPVSVSAMLSMVFSALGLAPRRVPIAYPLAAGCIQGIETICSRLPGRPEPPATVYSLGALAFSQTFDLTAARRDLRWTPRRSPEQTIAWAAGGLDASV